MTSCAGESALSDEDLVARILESGDRNAFAPIVERYRKPVMKLMYRMTGDYDGSLELAQETFIKAWSYLKSYRAGMRFSSWLFKIAANLAVDFNRKRSIRMEREGPLDDGGPEVAVKGWEQTLERGLFVTHLLGSLKEPYKTAVVLRFMRDLSYDEIAKIMQTTVEQVKNYLFRGRKHLLELAKEAC